MPPLATLVICLPPALMPLVPSIETPPTVTLLVVIPVDPIVVFTPIVAVSNVTFLAVAIVKVLPVWVISILSPLLKVTVSPPFTSCSAPLLAFTLKEAASFAAVLIACSSTDNVMSLPDAAVLINLLSPFTDNVSLLRLTEPVAAVSPPILRAWLPVALSTALVIAVLTAVAISLASTTPAVPVKAPVAALAANVPFATSTVMVCPFTVALAAPVPTTFNFSVFKLTVPLFVPSVTPRFVDKLATASLAIVLTSPMLATLLLSALLLATIPVPTLVIALLPALMPLVPSIEIVPTVTLLVVTPVDPIVVFPPIVAVSNVTFLDVPIVNVLPFWVIAILSPLLKATVSPPLTSCAAVALAFTLNDDASLAASLIACSLMVNVTSLPVALVVRYVELPLLTPKLTLPELNDLAVVVPVSPPREIVRATAVAESVIDCFVAVLRSKDT